jgi:hypothetical protein
LDRKTEHDRLKRKYMEMGFRAGFAANRRAGGKPLGPAQAWSDYWFRFRTQEADPLRLVASDLRPSLRR